MTDRMKGEDFKFWGMTTHYCSKWAEAKRAREAEKRLGKQLEIVTTDRMKAEKENAKHKAKVEELKSNILHVRSLVTPDSRQIIDNILHEAIK